MVIHDPQPSIEKVEDIEDIEDVEDIVDIEDIVVIDDIEDQSVVEPSDGEPEISSDLFQSPGSLARDYYLILPLQFRFLRKDSPLFEN